MQPHDTYGAIGAVLAGGLLRGFGAPQLLEPLNVMATLLVAAGFAGEKDGMASIYRKVLSGTFDLSRVIAGRGGEWLLTIS